MKNILFLLLLLVFSCSQKVSNFDSKPLCVGEQIKQARKEKSISKEEFSKQVNISLETIDLIESCQATPMHTKWSIIEETLNIKIKP